MTREISSTTNPTSGPQGLSFWPRVLNMIKHSFSCFQYYINFHSTISIYQTYHLKQYGVRELFWLLFVISYKRFIDLTNDFQEVSVPSMT
jgi:hypothetical protein